MRESLFNFQENLVKCGAAAAPVTDWLLYDTVYTERYMAKYPSITISITINITVMVMIVLLNTERYMAKYYGINITITINIMVMVILKRYMAKYSADNSWLVTQTVCLFLGLRITRKVTWQPL